MRISGETVNVQDLPALETLIVEEGTQKLNKVCNCPNLNSVSLPSTLTEFGFSGDSKIVEFTLPTSVVRITGLPRSIKKLNITDMDAFMQIETTHFLFVDNDIELYLNGKLVTELVFTSECKNVPNIFCGYNKIEKITIQDGVENISDGAFIYMDKVESLEIPNSVKTMGSYPFDGMTNLRTLTIGNVVETLESSCFKDNIFLYEIYNTSSHDVRHIFKNAAVIHDSLNEESIYTMLDDFIFYRSNNEYVLCQYLGEEKILYLPDSINGCEYSVEKNVFYTNETVEELHVSKGVKKLSRDIDYKNIIKIYIHGNNAELENNGVNVEDKNIREIYRENENLVVHSGNDSIKRVIHNNTNEPSVIEKIGDYVFMTVDSIPYLIAYDGEANYEEEITLPADFKGQSIDIQFTFDYRVFGASRY